jgi:hypothetical protein
MDNNEEISDFVKAVLSGIADGIPEGNKEGFAPLSRKVSVWLGKQEEMGGTSSPLLWESARVAQDKKSFT